MKKVGLILVLAAAGFLGYRFLGGDAGYEIKNIPISVSRIVCFGDSLTYGVGASREKDYPSRLAGLTGIEVINSGISGNTTADGLARLQEDVLDYQPDVVLITLGGNDLKNRVAKDRARANLIAIIRGIQDAGAMVVLGGLDIPLYGRGFSDMYAAVARETGAVLIPNIFDGIFGNRRLMSDPIHPNDKGYEIMAGYFYRALLPYLNS
ncbi:MAG: arylesterase [Desulfobacter sp.]|nr:MAG: arylesterase [Desulfobacter sp.]